MNVCFVGKYPPIEGGVSTRNYWTTYGLARAGHDVFVVTNAGEVEERFRLTLQAEDAAWYEPRFAHGAVRVFSSSVGEDRLAYIPSANPFVSKLASIATQVIREHGCEVLLASYFEPYGVAAYLASRFTGIPLVVTHAGSDLGRLMREPELATTFKEILKGADRVVTARRFRDRFAGFGVDPERIAVDAPFAIPADVFSPHAATLPTLAAEYPVPVPVRPDGTVASWNDALAAPRIGIYGKVGAAKGSFDLVTALGRRRGDGAAFSLLAMTKGHDVVSKRFRERLVADGLADRAFLLPFLPNWCVPSFVRTCTAVCFLERDFPIVSHGPIVAREVLACGVPLILSREIANKQLFRDAIVPGENAWIVEDPKDHAELAAVLAEVIADPVRAAAVGARGHALSRAIEDTDAFVSYWAALLAEVAHGSPVAASPPAVATVRERLADALPAFAELAGETFGTLVAAFEDHGHAYARGDRRIAAQFLAFVWDRHGDDLDRLGPYARETTAYLLLSLRMSGDVSDGAMLPFREPDRAAPGRLSPTVVASLRPALNRSAVIETFSRAALRLAGNRVGADGDDAATEILLFNRTPNLERCELQINAATRELLQLCDGTRTTETIAARLGADAERVVRALERFHALGVVAFH